MIEDDRDPRYAPGVDIIVVAYQQPVDVERFVRTLLENPPAVEWSLHFVDVGTADGVGSKVEHQADRLRALIPGHQVHFRTHSANVGFNRAVNDALTVGDRQTVAVFNADTAFIASPADTGRLPGENVVDRMDRLIVTEPGVGVVGPRQIDSRGKITAGGIFGTMAEPKHRDFGHAAAGPLSRDVRRDAVVVAGSAFAASRHMLDELQGCPIHADFVMATDDLRGLATPTNWGPLLPTTHFWGETWLCYHALAHGYVNWYVGDVTMIHECHGAPNSLGWARQHRTADQALFRAACDHHGIAHD